MAQGKSKKKKGNLEYQKRDDSGESGGSTIGGPSGRDVIDRATRSGGRWGG